MKISTFQGSSLMISINQADKTSGIQFLRNSCRDKEALIRGPRTKIGLEGRLGFVWGGKKKIFKMKRIENEF